MATLFPLGEYWWLYAAFTAGVLLLLFFDLRVLHRHAHEVRFREATLWSAAWVGLALAFNAALYVYATHAFRDDPRLAAIPGFDPETAAWQVASNTAKSETIWGRSARSAERRTKRFIGIRLQRLVSVKYLRRARI